MGLIIHARKLPEGIRYRVWSTYTDRYVTDLLTETEIRDALLAEAKERSTRLLAEAGAEISARIERTNDKGTSEMMRFAHDRPTELYDPWDTELCKSCSRFHHDYVCDSTDGTCKSCGEDIDDPSHLSPCPREK